MLKAPSRRFALALAVNRAARLLDLEGPTIDGSFSRGLRAAVELAPQLGAIEQSPLGGVI